MMEEKLPGCGIKACPHITSRIKTLKKLWQTAYDMVYGTNTSGFGWDPDTKCVTADKEVWDEYIKAHSRAAQFRTKSFPNFESLTMKMARVKMTPDRLKELGITMEDVRNYRKHMATIQRCGREEGSKYRTKEDYDEYEGVAKWKRDNEAKEAKKRKRAERKTAKVEAKKQGKAKVIVSESSGGDDKGWKPTESNHGSSEGNEEEEDIVGEGKRRAKLYQKLKKVHRRLNMVPESKADFYQSTLEDYDVSSGTSPNPTSKQYQGRQDPTHEDTDSSEHVEEEKSDDKSNHSEDDFGARLSDNDGLH
ncbi:hypothetical protein K1719_010260 [Acacia pycnantha]|nr:hypothetical protein K1719_010260 [Acacia pycnantha]